jgi:hypothetical protein
MKNKYIYIVSIVIVAVLFTGLLLSHKNQKTEKQPVATISSTSTVAQITPTPVHIEGWKQFTNAAGVRFQYPPDWTEIQTNNGPGFTSPDHQMTFIIRGPYSDESSSDKVAKQEATGYQVLSRVKTTILGHPAIQQEILTPNTSASYGTDGIDIYIGNFKILSQWPNGSPNIEYGTLVPGITIMDKSQHDTAVTIFNQILSTFQFTK